MDKKILKKRNWKRILFVTFVLTMMFTVLPVNTVTVYAKIHDISCPNNKGNHIIITSDPYSKGSNTKYVDYKIYYSYGGSKTGSFPVSYFNTVEKGVWYYQQHLHYFMRCYGDHHVHDFSIPATCTKPVRCSICSFESYLQSKAALGHDWQYTAEGASLTASCSRKAECAVADVSLTLASPAPVYSGRAQGLTEITGLTDFNTATKKNIALSDIKYWTDAGHNTATTAENSGAASTNAAPVNVGTYYATLTIDTDKTASVSFTIDKAPISAVTFKEPAAPAFGNTPASDITGEKEGYAGAISWNPPAEKFKHSTVYTAKVTLTADSNHKFASAVTVPSKWTKDASSTDTALVLTRTYPATEVHICGNGVKQDGLQATCTEAGYKDYYHCSKCEKIYEEADCKTEITDLPTWKITEGQGKVDALGHHWFYTANGAKLTASCSRKAACAQADVNVALALSAVSQTYSGSPITKSDLFSLTGFDSFKAATGIPALSASEAVSSIKIFATDENGKKTGTDISASALDAGKYIAEFELTVATEPSAVTRTISKIFAVSKATAAVSLAPTANTLTYSGEAQELVSSAGTVTGGVLMYSLEKTGTYSADIPVEKNAGEYRVYYKVVSDSDNYKDSELAYVDVTIARKNFEAATTVSGNILAGFASSGSLEIPAVSKESLMSYGTPTTSAAVLGDLSIAGGRLLYEATADVAAGSTYTVTIPVTAQNGEYGNYNDFTITVNFVGRACSHDNKTDTPEFPATCTLAGSKAYSICDTCGSFFYNGEIIASIDDIILPAPGHDWKVKEEYYKLVASCSRKFSCGATDKKLTLYIDSKAYDGEAHEGTSLSESEKTAWEAIGLSVPTIIYAGVDGTVYESETPPTEIGSYEARISFGTGENEKIARAEFTIYSPIRVTFDPNGGRFESEMLPALVENGRVSEPIIGVSNGRMNFCGWYKDPEGYEKWDFENDIVTEDITLYAVWGYPAGSETELAEMSVGMVKDFYYTGKKITPDVRVYFGGKLLTRNIDYTVSYKNVINASAVSVSNNLIIKGDGSVDCSKVDTAKLPSIIIKGKGNYSKKSVSLNFNILPLTLGDGGTILDKNVSADITDVFLQDTKKAITVNPAISYGGKKLTKNRDYTITLKAVDAVDASGTAIAAGTEYSNLTLPKGVSGSFVLIATGKGNYTGSFKKEITVSKGELLTLQKASIRIKKIPYLGENLEIQDVIEKGELTVKVKGKTLTYGEDYTVAFAEGCSAQSRLSAGSYPIVITGKGSYTGSKMSNAVVQAVSVKKAVVTFAEDKPVYTGGHIGLNIGSVTVPVKVNGETTQKTLVRGVDYTATVFNDVKAGKAKVKITGIGAFAGSKTVSYRIQKKKLSADMFASGTFTDDNTVELGNFDYYGGASVIPTVTIVNDAGILISPTDYIIKARNNRQAGSNATGTIVGKGNYTGSIKCTFSIGPDNVDSEKISIAKAKVKIENQIYTGNEITLRADSFKSVSLKVKEGSKTVTKDLVLGRDFDIVDGSYRNNINWTGKVKATVTLRGIGANGFDGYKTVEFRIVKKDLKWWEKIMNLL